MKTRVMSIVLAALMILALIPSTAFAEETALETGAPAPTQTVEQPEAPEVPEEAETPEETSAPEASEEPEVPADPGPDALMPVPDAGLSGLKQIPTEIKGKETGADAEGLSATRGIFDRTLTVSITGQGSVNKPASSTYFAGTPVSLVATPAGGWRFVRWEGDLSGSDSSQTIWMTSNKAVTAVFELIPTYTLTTAVNGQGSVTKDPDQANYNDQTQVKITATPAAGWRFTGWSGDTSGSANPKNIVINGNKNITANFELIPLYTLTVNKVGSGSVTLNPNLAQYEDKTKVTLTAAAASGWRFGSWSGDLSGTSASKTLDMTGNKTVTATFIEQCTVSISKEGSGTIFPNLVAGVYDVGQTIDLGKAAPIPALGWSFRGWRDNGTGNILSGSTVQLTSSSASFTAVFFDSEELHVRAGAHGSLGTNINGDRYERGQTVDLNSSNPTGEPGYVFDKWMEYGLYWSGGGTNTGASITIGDSNWFEAKFKVAEYTVSYNLNGGSASGNPTSYTYFDAAFTLNNPTKTGYIFNGWSGTGIADNTMSVTVPTHSSGNKEYTANWTPISYTVNYHANGGTGSMNPSNYSYDSAGTLSANVFTMTGCAFSGWAMSANGDVVYGDGADVDNWTAADGDVFNLYAKWEVSDIVVSGYNQKYDGAYHGVTVSGAADGATVTYSTDGMNYSSTSPQFKDVTVAGGELVYVKVQIPGASDYDGSARVEITKADLTVKAGNKTVAYGSAAPSYTYTITGFVAGEKKNQVVTGAPVLACVYGPGNPVGTYDITITQGTLAAANYAFVMENGTLTVNKKALTVTAEPKSVTYGDGAPAYTYKIEGFIDGEDAGVLTGEPKLVCTYAQGNPAGSYLIDVKKNTLAADNYKFTLVDGTLTVDKAALTVTANDKSITYGQAAPAFDVTYGAFVMGQTEAVLGGSLSFGCDYGTVSSDAGSYDIVPAGLTSDNYEISFIAGKLTVDPAALTVTAKNESILYGGDKPDFSVDYSGFVAGDTEGVLGGTLGFDCAYAPGSAVGDYDIMPKDLSSNNYDITFEKGTLTVDPAALTVTAENKMTIYGSAAPDFSVVYSGFVLNEDALVLSGSADYDCDYVIGSAVGGYDIMPKGLSSGNYDITFEKGTLTVNPAALTVTADDMTVTYLDAPPVYTATYAGFVAGDDTQDLSGALTFDCDYVRGSALGDYAITPGGLTSGNYTISFVDGTLTVTQLILTVRFEDYDGTLIATDRVAYGNAADAPDDPEREGYDFTGWDRDFDNVRTNITVTATYAIKTFTVTFEDYDGTVLSTDTVEWNTAATPPADPERDGYTFTGWDADFSAVKADMTVTAQYNENAVIENEPVPETGGNGEDDTVVLQDDGVPLNGPAAFPWWWIVIGVGVAGLLFLLILFLVKRRKGEQKA